MVVLSRAILNFQRAVRIFCREKAPVGGISVKEHFEINVVPFTIGTRLDLCGNWELPTFKISSSQIIKKKKSDFFQYIKSQNLCIDKTMQN